MKKINKIFLTLCLALFAGFGLAQEPNPDAFITVWEPTGTTINFPGVGNNYTIVVRDVATGNVVQTISDASSVAGTPYQITGLTPGVKYALEVVPNGIRATDFNGFKVLQEADDPNNERLNLLEIQQWGAIEWNRTTGLVKAFLNCENLELTATDKPVFTTSPQNLSGMFQGCTSLTGEGSSISDWDMTNVVRISQMFAGATSFNQPLNWDVSNITAMIQTFGGASSFNQNLGSWNLNPSLLANGGTNMFSNSGMSGENYANTLIGWANNPNTPDGIILGATGVCYNKSGAEARAKLVAKGWTITDDGECILDSKAELISNSKFSLIRNPVEENAYFIFEPSSIGDKIIIADLSGKIIIVKSIVEDNRTEINIPLSYLPKGVYVAMYKDIQGKQATIKLVK